VADDDVRVPAGWYPDPLGLPQLRWWDNHAWTEHTSDARQPTVQPQPMRAETATPTRLAFADDLPFADDLADLDDSAYPAEVLPDLIEPSETGLTGLTGSLADGIAQSLPSRRSLRAQERLETDDDGARELVGDSAGFAQPRGAIASRDADPAAAAVRYAEAARIDDAPQSLRYDLDEVHEDLLGETAVPRSAFAHASKSDANLIPDYPAEREPAAQSAYATRRSALAHAPSTSTVPAWILTLLPVYMLLVGMMVLLGGTDASLAPVTIALVVGVPWVAGVVISFFDHRMLRRHGMHRPAHWLWALLGAPVYLIARLVATVREAGTGFGPVLTYLVLALFMAGAVVAVPGLAMELSPASFSAEAERSIADDARSLGADLTIDCPDTPPLLVQQSFTCRATNSDGQTFDVRVSLQRSNGWIDWRVDNWGIFSTVGS
jgi:hypothetical protein